MKTPQGPEANSSERFRIGVDVRRALEVLSGNVFAGQQACIRELIANASDSITRLPLKERGNVEIRLIPDRANGTLVVSDNGVGMTRTEATTLLGTIFGGAKEARKDVVGQFGIGFYSCFPLCSKVEVLTKTRCGDDPGTHIFYAGGQTLQLSSAEVDSPGTIVRLHLLDSHRSLLDNDVLLTLVTKDCNFVPYPIYLGTGWTLLNSLDAPWYHQKPEAELRDGLRQFFRVEDVLALVPIHEDLGDGAVRGVIYIAPPHEKPILRIYSRRVLITEAGKRLLDDSLGAFLSGIVDAEDLPLVISRDAILEGSPQADSLRCLLLERLGKGLAGMAVSRNKDFRRLMAEQGRVIKEACLEHPPLLAELRDHFTFRSSLRSSVTVPEYLSKRDDSTVIFADDMSVGTSLIPLYNQANIEVLFMTDSVDRRLRDRWKGQSGKIKFKRLDEDPPTGSTPESVLTVTEADRSSLEALRLLFRSAVDKRLQVELRSLGPDAPPAVLALSEEDRKHLQFVEGVRSYEKQGRMSELPAEVQQMVRHKGFLDFIAFLATQTIILNLSNTIVQGLIGRLQTKTSSERGKYLEPQIAKFLFGQGLLSAGMHLSTEKLTQISQDQTALITTLLKRVNDPG